MKIRSVWLRPLLPTAILSATNRRPSERSPEISSCSPRRSRRSVSSGYRSTPSRSTEIAFSRCAPDARARAATRIAATPLVARRRSSGWSALSRAIVNGGSTRVDNLSLAQPSAARSSQNDSRASPADPNVGAPSGLPQRSKRRDLAVHQQLDPTFGDPSADRPPEHPIRAVCSSSSPPGTVVLACEKASMSGDDMLPARSRPSSSTSRRW